DEPGAVIEVQGPGQAIAVDKPVQATQEKVGTFAGADDDLEPHARRIVEEMQCNATKPLDTRTEVFSVTQDHEHSVGVRESSHVLDRESLGTSKRQAPASTRPPQALATDAILLSDHPTQPCALDELRKRDERIAGLFQTCEFEHGRAQYGR